MTDKKKMTVKADATTAPADTAEHAPSKAPKAAKPKAPAAPKKKAPAKKPAEAPAPARTIKAFEAAKDLKMSADAFLALLKELDFPIKNRMSAVTPEQVQAAKDKMEADKQAVKKDQVQKKIIQEKVEAAAKAEAKAAVPEPGPVVVSTIQYPEELTKPYPEAQHPPRPVAAEPAPATRRPVAEEQRGGHRRKRKKKRDHRPVIDQTVVAATVKQTMAAIERGKARRTYKKDKEEAGPAADERVVRLPEYSSISDLAQGMGVKPSEVIAKAMGLGLMVTINQRLDLDTLATIADDFGYTVEEMQEFAAEQPAEELPKQENLQPRPPVVTVMGHVDHGKTSLLDRIRKTNVVEGEFGGITQHIGASEVRIKNQRITFLDTPGHEAFTAMRARGARVTDIVILVVAATEGMMPQTEEAIDHAQAAKVPIIVAINKMDLPGADPMRVKQELSKKGLNPEDWGGKTIMVELSAKTGAGVDKLLEMVLLQSEMMELKADPGCLAKGAVVESRLDKGKGILATVLVEQGTMEKGQPFVAGLFHGRIRAMYDEHGAQVKTAGPSTAVQVQGFDGAPMAGDTFQVMESESAARELASKRQQLKREQDSRPAGQVTLQGLYDQMKDGEAKELKLVVKGDVGGSVEAISDAVYKLSTDTLKLSVIHKGVGAITESDVHLAIASQAIIIGFHVRPEERARELAEREGIEIRIYNIIYEALEDLQKAQKGMLAPVIKEVVQGRVEVRQTYKISGVGTIAGCQVTQGAIARSHRVRLLRDNVEIYSGKLASLKRFKDDVREVQNGMECGLGLDNFNDVKVGDIVEAFTMEEQKTE
ncbi:MAG: translation initiation factor IF-2 [Candidatus Edwardsbacteria bacterium]|jgi:translation initiation factor IF-2|nr:translation initiation factor IF-2 [Candidatus Edwardsbacteria bacterium]